MLPLFPSRSNPMSDLSDEERPSFNRYLTALYNVADADLREWLKEHGAHVKDVAADALIGLRPASAPPVSTVAVDGSLASALRWTFEAAKRLVANTHFDGDKMVRDEDGASVATYPTLVAYIEEPDPALIPLSTHAAAIETLRLHSLKQLRRSEWDAAYATIKRAVEAAGGTMPREEEVASIRSPQKAPASGLPDRTYYTFNKPTGEVFIEAGIRQGAKPLFPMVKEAASAGVISGGDFRSLPKNPERPTYFPFAVRARAVKALADVIEATYPNLAAVFRQHADYWMQFDEGAKAVAAEVATTSDAYSGDANSGRVPSEDVRWTFKPEQKQVRIYLPFDVKVKDLTTYVGPPATYQKDEQGVWFASIPASGGAFEKAAAFLAERGKVRSANAVRSLRDTWLAVGKTSVEQSREAGEVLEEGASWRLITSQTPSGKLRETVAFALPRSVSFAFGQAMPGAKWDSSSATTHVNAKVVPQAAEWLRAKGLVRFAEALARAFGGVKGVIDEEEAHCATMLSMSRGVRGVVNPEQVEDPKAQETIAYIRSALHQRVLDKRLTPFPFQLVGMAFAKLTGYRTMIADAPGLGKTIQAIGTMIADPEMLLPAIIVCPKNVAANWIAEIRTWMPNTKTQMVNAQTALDPSAHIYVMGYETLRSRIDEFESLGAALVPYLTHEVERMTKERQQGIEKKKSPTQYPSEEEIAEKSRALVKAQQVPEDLRIRYFIADEAHKFKDPSAGWSKAGRRLANVVPHAMFLSGTPMMNKFVELHAVLSMLHPDTWGSLAAFKKAYVGVRTITKVVKGKKKTIEEEVLLDAPSLHKRMGCQIIRRRKMDALADLVAPKTRVKVPICVTEQEARVYQEAVIAYEAYVTKRAEGLARQMVDAEVNKYLVESGLKREDLVTKAREDILASEHDIRRGYYDEAALRKRGIPLDDVIARAEAEADEKIDAALTSKGMTVYAIEERIKEYVNAAVESALKAEILTQLTRLLELIGMFKVPAVVDMVKSIHAQKAPATVTKNNRVAPEGVVVFAKHKSVMDAYRKAFQEAGIRVGVIDGGPKSTPEARLKVVNDFQNGDLDVVLASEAGREGLTLTRAKYLIMGQRYWNPAAEQQAEDRIHRIGQKRDATILFPYIERAIRDPEGATADDYMQRIILLKRGRVQEALGDDAVEEEEVGELEEETESEAEDVLDEDDGELLTVTATVKALKKGQLCVDPRITRASVADVRKLAEESAAVQMRQNPRAFQPAAVPSRSEVQTVLFDRRAWSKAAAEAWLRHHGYSVRGVDSTEHYHRFRQHDPHLYVPGSFRTISFTSSIKAVVGRR